jgi:hypothetical protein
MNWYIVKLVFSIDRELGDNRAQFDEQIRLVNAKNSSDAYFKARNLGKKEESAFSTDKNETVKWRFIDVPEISLLGELKDGVELYSNTIEIEEKTSYISSILKKGMSIQSRGLVLT